MAINPQATSAARQPRGIVQINGVRIDAWVRWSVDNNTYYEADTFSVTFALSALPAAFNDAWWASQQEIFAEVFAGFPVNPDTFTEGELSSLTYGRVDEVAFNPVARTLHISGRDLTAALIDAKTSETFQNLTSSQIATTFAQRHGLTSQVTITKKLSGKYYQTDTVRVNQQRSEWDLLTALAAEEGFSVFVKGKVLYFGPPPVSSENPYQLKWEVPSDQTGAFSFNGKAIEFSRALNFARGVVVTVLSISPKTGKSIKVTFPSKAANVKPGQSKPQAQQFTFKFPKLTYERALQKAQQIHDDISRHEVKLRATLPADNLLSVRNLISVVGTGTSFDQTYYPECITREMDMDLGYAMTIKAKNHSPQSVVPL